MDDLWLFQKRWHTKTRALQTRGKFLLSNPGEKALLIPNPLWNKQSRVVVHHKHGLYMIRLVNLIFFPGCALVVAHYYALGSMVQLLGAVGVALVLMRVLSSKRIH
jgi:hypothetical protein